MISKEISRLMFGSYVYPLLSFKEKEKVKKAPINSPSQTNQQPPCVQ